MKETKMYMYLDNAATTNMKQEVLDEMIPFFIDNYGNPSANYDLARVSKVAIEKAREQIADLINSKPDEIYFTSGGTESDNWALLSATDKYGKKGKHIITTSIEHHAILHTTQFLEEKGYEVTYLKVDKNGIIDVEDLEKAIRPDTILISVMMANNEIGTIQPIKEIGTIARKNKVLFHTDAVQAIGHIPIDVSKMKIDLLSGSGHKFHGPKGIGFLYVKNGLPIAPFIHGGAQENGKRAGTSNVPGIVGMGKAAEMAKRDILNAETSKIRDYFIDRLIKEIPLCHMNGDINNRLPNNINIRIDYVDADSLLVLLNQKGLYASSGSACTTGQTNPSHVLKALGLSDKEAKSSIRLSISDDFTIEEADNAVEIITECVNRLRKVSSEYKKVL